MKPNLHEKHSEFVATAKAMISRDIASGEYKIPEDCPSFTDLHDYVDANEYVLLEWFITWDDPTDPEINIAYAQIGAVQDELDRWLAAGRP